MANAAPPQIIDDKSIHCIPFILSRLHIHQSTLPNTPFIIGLNGVQGAGKTTLVAALCNTLRTQESLETLVLSIDDLYLTHADQVALATSHVDNPLVQHRGEPGTHDIVVATALFNALRAGTPTAIPQYNKSAFGGRGDRVPSSQWTTVNGPSQPPVRVVIFEGWSVGFRALSADAVRAKQEASRVAQQGTLWKHRLEDLLFVNEKLGGYDAMTNTFDAFIHVDAEDTRFVYDWRLQQEAALRKEKGTAGAMTDEEVITFVDGYYPAYELYTDALREGVFKDRGKDGEGRQLRLVVAKDRRVIKVVQI